jgi:iron complex outermembrane receptor protein
MGFIFRREFWGVAIGLIATLSFGQDAPDSKKKNLTDLSLEDLMNIKVTSATKMSQSLFDVASAISVITQNDIHRSGVRNIAEALRLAPGVQVQELSGHFYAITIRGFNNPNYDGSYGNKLLVLIDGRTLYSPYTSTTYWEVEDLILEDIDRIEVIRGPGGTLYGANAVNGVVNIVTKSAEETVGSLAVSSIGTFDKDRFAFRYGWKPNKAAAVRFFGKIGTDGRSLLKDGSSYHDGGSFSEMGFRADFADVAKGSLMVQGEYNRFGIYEDLINPILTAPYFEHAINKDQITTSHVLANWKSPEVAGKQTEIQAYYDLLDYPYSTNSSVGTTWDLTYQQKKLDSKGGSTIFGAGYRYELNNSTPSLYQSLDPLSRRDTIANVFAQREMPIGTSAKLIFGAKLEHNTFTGFEFQPNVRYLQNIDDSHVFWGSVSRAVRTPSQSELNEHSIKNVEPPAGPGALPTAYINFGNNSLTSEILIANELGYRVKASESLSFDMGAFYNMYSNLTYMVDGTPYEDVQFGIPVIVVPQLLKSGEKGNTYGLEVVSRKKLSANTHLTLSYSFVGQDHFSHGSDIDAPKHQFSARISHSLPKNLELDAMAFHYSAVPGLSGQEYTKLDASVSWKPTKDFELSLIGHDLLKPRQFSVDTYSYIPRSIDLRLSYHF